MLGQTRGLIGLLCLMFVSGMGNEAPISSSSSNGEEERPSLSLRSVTIEDSWASNDFTTLSASESSLTEVATFGALASSQHLVDFDSFSSLQRMFQNARGPGELVRTEEALGGLNHISEHSAGVTTTATSSERWADEAPRLPLRSTRMDSPLSRGSLDEDDTVDSAAEKLSMIRIADEYATAARDAPQLVIPDLARQEANHRCLPEKKATKISTTLT